MLSMKERYAITLLLVSNKKDPNNGIILLKPLEDISLYDVFIAINKDKLGFKNQDNLDMILIEEYKKIKISLFRESV